MGSIIGGILGGVGSLFGGSMQKSADDKAAQQALTGYNYLTTGAGANNMRAYMNNGTNANNQAAALLGLGGDTAAAQQGFNNYLGSTGYQFQLGQGQDAIASSQAAKGLLNSGATAKALTQYGQNLASTTFNNYLGQLSGLSQGGQTALGQIGAAGSAGGGAAANATMAGGEAQAKGLNGALGGFGNALGQVFSGGFG